MNNQKNVNISIGRMIIMIILLMIVVVGGTFAWFTFSSKQSALVLTIGNINNTQITLTPYQVKQDAMTPVNTYTSGVSSDVIIKNNEKNNSVALYYKINQLDPKLIAKGLRYTIVDTSSNTVIVPSDDYPRFDGTFNGVGSEQKEFLIFETTNIDSNSTLNYRVYLWVDSSEGNQNDIVDSKIDIELNGAIGSVEISGSNMYGSTLVANITDFDSHITSDEGLNNSTTDYQIQWYVSSNDDMTGSTSEKICNATSRSYMIGSDLGSGTGCIDGSKAIFAGKYVYVLVTVIKENGAYTKTYKDLADSKVDDGDSSNDSDTVLVKPINVTAGSHAREYNGEELKVSSCSSDGLLNGHQVSCVMTEGSKVINVFSQSNQISTATIRYNSSDVTANYDITKVNGVLTVNPKKLTLNWEEQVEYEYDCQDQAPIVSVDTGVAGETMTLRKTTGIDVGDYTSTASCSGVTGGQQSCSNYTLLNNTKDFKIIPKPVEVIWGDITEFPYNGKPQAPTANAKEEDVCPNETMTVNRTTETAVGNHISEASCSGVTGGQGKCNNYQLKNTSKEFSIILRELDFEVIAPETYSKEYDGTVSANPDVVVNFVNTVNADKPSVSVSCEFSDPNVGTNKKITCLISLDSSWTDKYQIADGNDSFEIYGDITPKNVAVTWGTETEIANNFEYNYNGQYQAPTAAVVDTGVAGETIVLDKLFFKDAGNYVTEASCEDVIGGQEDCLNYNLTNTEKQFTIKKIKLSVTLTAEDKIYDGTNTASCDFKINGAVVDENPTITVNNCIFGTIDVGNERNVFSLIYISNDWKTNYELESNTPETTAKITPKSIEVEWGEQTEFAHDGASHIPTVTTPMTGVNNETINLTLSEAKILVGSYTATASCESVKKSSSFAGSGKCSNYTITNPTKNFIIYKNLTAQFIYNDVSTVGSTVSTFLSCRLETAGQTSCTITTPEALGMPSGYTFRGWSISRSAKAPIGQLATETEFSVHGALPNTEITLNKTSTLYYASYQKEATATFIYSTLSETDEVYSGHTGASITVTGYSYIDYKGEIFASASQIDIPSEVLNSTGGAGAAKYNGLIKNLNSQIIEVESSVSKVPVENATYYAEYKGNFNIHYYMYSAANENEKVRTFSFDGTSYTMYTFDLPSFSGFGAYIYNGIDVSGWSSDNNSVNDVHPKTSAFSDYYAYYQQDITINYSCGSDVSNCPSSHDVTVLEIIKRTEEVNTAKLSDTTPTKTNYTFQGWINSSGDTYAVGAYYDGKGSTKNQDGSYSVTLTADFLGNPYTVSYYLGTTLLGTSSHRYGDGAQLTLFEDFTLTNQQQTFHNDLGDYNWEFAGWSTDTLANLEYSNGELITAGNQSLYAVYSRIVTFWSSSASGSGMDGESPQYYNPYDENNSLNFAKIEGDLSSVRSFIPRSIENFEAQGYVRTAGNVIYAIDEDIDLPLKQFPELNAKYVSTKEVSFISGGGFANTDLRTIKKIKCDASYVTSVGSIPTTCTVTVPSKDETAVVGFTASEWDAIGYRNQNQATHLKTYDFDSTFELNLTDNIEYYAIYSRSLTFYYSVESAASGGTITPGEVTGTVLPKPDPGVKYITHKFDSGSNSTNAVIFPTVVSYYEYSMLGWTTSSNNVDFTYGVGDNIPVFTSTTFYDVRYKDVNAYSEPSKSNSLRIYIVYEVFLPYELPSSCSDTYNDYNWECVGWTGATSASSPSYSLGQTLRAGITVLYAIYSREITAYSGNNDDLTTHKATQYMNASSNNVSTLTFPTTTNTYSFDKVVAERGDDFTFSAFEFACSFCEATQYAPSYNIVPVNPNAIYKRDAILYQLGGSDMIDSRPAYSTQYYSSAGNYKLYMTITESIYGYSILGYVDSDDDAFAYNITRITGYSFTYTGSSNTLYAVYTKEVECVSGYSDSTVIDSVTIYFSASYRQAASFPMKSGLDDWTFRGWRSDTTAADREYGGATTMIISGVPDKFYAVYSRDKTFTYYKNGGIDRLPDTNPVVKPIYMNSSSLTTSDQSLIVSSKFPFKEGGYAFLGWAGFPGSSSSSVSYIPGQKYAFYADPKESISDNWNRSFYAIYGLVSQGYATVSLK